MGPARATDLPMSGSASDRWLTERVRLTEQSGTLATPTVILLPAQGGTEHALQEESLDKAFAVF